MKKKSGAKGVIFTLGILFLLGLGGYAMSQSKSTLVVSEQTQVITPTIQKQETVEDSVDAKLAMSKKMVMAIVAKKDIVDQKKVIMDKSNAQAKVDTDEYNNAIKEYNDTLEASKLYGAGALEIFFEVGNDRGMFKKATTTVE